MWKQQEQIGGTEWGGCRPLGPFSPGMGWLVFLGVVTAHGVKLAMTSQSWTLDTAFR